MNSTTATATTAPVSVRQSRFLDWFTTVDHKKIGLLYIWTAFAFFAVGGFEALAIRMQLAMPNNHFLSPEAYNEIFTMHGTTMVFLVGMPVLIGFANYFMPLMIGARDVAFPRLNALSYWFLLFGGLLLHFSLFASSVPAVGWFSYAPLSEKAFMSNQGPDYWAMAILVMGFGSVAGAINLMVTTLKFRAPGLTMNRVPLFVWMSFITMILIVLALPALNAAAVLLLIDRLFNTAVFQPMHGGNAVLWQHFFWMFGHPEVYILVLPAFGMISEVIPVYSRQPIYGYNFIAASTVAIAILSFGVWAHHMFTVGLGHAIDYFFAAGSLLIAVPTGVKIWNWIATMWGGSIRFTTSMLYAIGFLVCFVIGGLSGITFAAVPIDWQTTDTYYVVAHFHYVLFGGTVFAVFAGVYYWFPKMSGRMLDETLGKWSFWTMLIGFNMTFFVQHFLGLMGMPRRVYTYPDLPYWGALNMISTIGAFIIGVSVIIFVVNLIKTFMKGEPAGENPWDAWTLEWATTSPPSEHNFERVPPVGSRRPLWDLKHPENPDWEHDHVHGGTGNLKMPTIKLSVLFLIASEVVFFSMLITAFVMMGRPESGPDAANSLNIPKTGFFSIFLFSSSLTLWFAERALRRNNSKGFGIWMLVTILFGATFVIGQGIEYTDLFLHGVTINRNLFATTFFTLTGFHGFHVICGLIVLSIVWILNLRKGGLTSKDCEMVEAVGYYWHFVDAVWVFIFSIVYLGVL